jgi:hypothetical protein
MTNRGNMKTALLVALIILVTALCFARRIRKGSHHDLCTINTAFVSGNSESAGLVRKQLAKRTWLRLVPSADKADAVLDISETRSEKNFPMRAGQTTVSATLTRNSTKDLVWSGSATFGEGPFNGGAGSAVKVLLGDLSYEANCNR